MQIPILSKWWNNQKGQMLTDALRIADCLNQESQKRDQQLLQQLVDLAAVVSVLSDTVSSYEKKEIVADVRGVAALVADSLGAAIARGLKQVGQANSDSLDELTARVAADLSSLSVAHDEAFTVLQKAVDAMCEAQQDLHRALEPQRVTRKSASHYYRKELERKGMAGSPIECDNCKSVFSDRWDRCDQCGKHKEQMPASCWIVP